jgi:UDPglucose 6-dehydrogenase
MYGIQKRSKLVANAFLAQLVSSVKAISVLSEKTDANVEEVAKVIGLDSLIGPKFLKSTVGFGGSCFQKDILILANIARSCGLTKVADLLEQIIIMNDYQKCRFDDHIISSLYNTVSGKKIFLVEPLKKTLTIRVNLLQSICLLHLFKNLQQSPSTTQR